MVGVSLAPLLNVYYLIGVDGISLWLIILSAFLVPFCILVSWQSIDYRIKEFYLLLFLIEFLLFNVFAVLDIFWFYAFLKVYYFLCLY